jgi:hypothetical protein
MLVSNYVVKKHLIIAVQPVQRRDVSVDLCAEYKAKCQDQLPAAPVAPTEDCSTDLP